jgi:NitT/TauT family transport system substrate-binding protein
MVMETRSFRSGKDAGCQISKTWATFRPRVMNDARFSSVLRLPGHHRSGRSACAGHHRRRVSLNALPLQLNTRSPTIKGIGDFTEKDKIAIPAVKVSMQARCCRCGRKRRRGQSR